jgi:hypothetical protein
MFNKNFIRIKSKTLYAEYHVYTYFIHNVITIIIFNKVFKIILKFFID